MYFVFGGIVDYLGQSLPKDYDPIFNRLSKNLFPIITGAYNLIMVLGMGALTIAGLIAILGYGLFKDAQLVKENKQWLGRILIAAVLSGSVLTFAGIFTTIKIGG